ncbi:hypothetical protein GCM10010112_83550 [Actinoplanes lobatus]|uniref:Uncharacterized protein n=1 Tax=Actinoplanes lobatus TaxID=113568 RepID=A0A7W7MJ64_9ACTN|nr:hypothetical protein [Actinoplanes lobatus]MBB4752312.1 hypothetical protein [Actinoplanes lobatus]GGN94343.1 hypothetical protein GCM10010112_83550 [Actinoplanes lobatus]GIE45997.1 hypothetical protein Alo02nite_88950 [Actinoplanes lobatus]
MGFLANQYGELTSDRGAWSNVVIIVVAAMRGVPLSRLAADYGTPLHVPDEADLGECCAEYAAAYGPGGAAYRAKAGLADRRFGLSPVREEA